MARWNKVTPVLLQCPQCRGTFWFRPRKRHSKKFCSHSCYTKSLKGKKHSVERIEKRAAAIRKTFQEHPEINRELGARRRGTKYPPSFGQKISESKSRSIALNGFSRPRRYRTEYTSLKTGKLEISDSSYELRRFKALDASPLVKMWTKKHGIRIPYKVGKRRHHYLPDIVVEYHDGRRYLEEVKGFVHDRMFFGAKNAAAIFYCSTVNMTFRLIFKEHLERVE